MIIKTKELNKMLKEEGRQYTITMYINHFFDMTTKQLERVLNYGEEQYNEKKKNIK